MDVVRAIFGNAFLGFDTLRQRTRVNRSGGAIQVDPLPFANQVMVPMTRSGFWGFATHNEVEVGAGNAGSEVESRVAQG
jgi:hypothetical protein